MLDTNGYNEHPDGADMEIEFCLAQRDPNGLASSGIVRYAMGNGEGWEFSQVEAVKAQTQWDPEKYFNIWVFDFIYSGIYELAAYAQFPVESGLEGLDGVPGMPSTAATDGVAVGYRYFGSEAIYPDGDYDNVRNLGRTLSHETGHYFGLRHIWGDENNCTATDYCDDTPATFTANSGCPEDHDSCEESPGFDMIQNYMDYTSDSCQNLFTLDQKARLQAVLANSPRRMSLATSDGCLPGAVFDNDGALHINRIDTACGQNEFTAEIVLSNAGNTTLTSAVISYNIDGGEESTYNWDGSLEQGEEEVITLPELTAPAGTHVLNIALASVNGGTDEAPLNDVRPRQFSITGTYTTNELIVTIQADNAGNQIIWMVGDTDTDAPIGGNINPNTGAINYLGNNSLNVINVPVEESGCYTFIMLDLGADGICCSNGEGYYKIETADGILIAEGGEFISLEQREFAIEATADTGEFTFGNVYLYPNPANSILNLQLPDAQRMPESYRIINSLGQEVGAGYIDSTLQTIDISRLSSGMYFVRLAKGSDAQTLKFIKQ